MSLDSAEQLDHFLANDLVVVHKNFLQLSAELLAQVVNCFYVCPTVRILLYRDDPVIACSVLLVALLSLDHSNRTTGKNTAGKGRLIHQH